MVIIQDLKYRVYTAWTKWKREHKDLYKSLKIECSNCGSKEQSGKQPIYKKLHLHHIDGNKANNNLNNLLCFCSSCHLKHHHKHKISYQMPLYEPKDKK